MISTSEQYNHTKELIAEFEDKLNWLATNRRDEDPRVRKLEMDGYASFLDSLRREANEYEAAHRLDLVGTGQK